jgi:hypothetical protein
MADAALAATKIACPATQWTKVGWTLIWNVATLSHFSAAEKDWPPDSPKGSIGVWTIYMAVSQPGQKPGVAAVVGFESESKLAYALVTGSHQSKLFLNLHAVAWWMNRIDKSAKSSSIGHVPSPTAVDFARFHANQQRIEPRLLSIFLNNAADAVAELQCCSFLSLRSRSNATVHA